MEILIPVKQTVLVTDLQLSIFLSNPDYLLSFRVAVALALGNDTYSKDDIVINDAKASSTDSSPQVLAHMRGFVNRQGRYLTNATALDIDYSVKLSVKNIELETFAGSEQFAARFAALNATMQSLNFTNAINANMASPQGNYPSVTIVAKRPVLSSKASDLYVLVIRGPPTHYPTPAPSIILTKIESQVNYLSISLAVVATLVLVMLYFAWTRYRHVLNGPKRSKVYIQASNDSDELSIPIPEIVRVPMDAVRSSVTKQVLFIVQSTNSDEVYVFTPPSLMGTFFPSEMDILKCCKISKFEMGTFHQPIPLSKRELARYSSKFVDSRKRDYPLVLEMAVPKCIVDEYPETTGGMGQFVGALTLPFMKHVVLDVWKFKKARLTLNPFNGPYWVTTTVKNSSFAVLQRVYISKFEPIFGSDIMAAEDVKLVARHPRKNTIKIEHYTDL